MTRLGRGLPIGRRPSADGRSARLQRAQPGVLSAWPRKAQPDRWNGQRPRANGWDLGIQKHEILPILPKWIDGSQMTPYIFDLAHGLVGGHTPAQPTSRARPCGMAAAGYGGRQVGCVPRRVRWRDCGTPCGAWHGHGLPRAPQRCRTTGATQGRSGVLPASGRYFNLSRPAGSAGADALG